MLNLRKSGFDGGSIRLDLALDFKANRSGVRIKFSWVWR